MSDKAKAAVAAILRRVSNDPRVAYFICPGSDTYDKVVAAHCELNALDEAEFRRDFELGLRFECPNRDE